MTQQQIQQIFQLRYNQNNWKQFLSQAFANARLLPTPEILTGINEDVATKAVRLGYVVLNENGIERNIAVYDVTLARGIVLERNRVGLRNLLRKYWKNIDAAFIVYHHSENSNWRFSYVSELTGFNAEGEPIKVKTEPKRYTYVLGEDESCRTAAERFAIIAKKGSKTTLDDVKDAFSVEKLSKAFFEEYKEHYENFVEFLTGKRLVKSGSKWKEKQTGKPNPQLAYIFNGDEKEARDFNKKLLGRIVFLYFIQKKGWMGVSEKSDWGQGDPNFLWNLFSNSSNKGIFYSEYLSILFFDTLNTQRKDDLIELIQGEKIRIPFLNGGLFEEDNVKYRNLIFPAELFENLFQFFNQYNFTIYEDDPNDHTVAVDPEMLGHIFENLLEDNKDKGAYYTPKEIVHYMCQESLIEYLTTWFEDKGYEVVSENIELGKEDKPELFPINEGRKQLTFESNKPATTKKIDRVLIEKLLKKKLDDADKELLLIHSDEFHAALDEVKICDPAIGSGAFPMGLLKEIFTAKQTLYTFKHGNTEGFDASVVKRNIIQNSIYGVDIEKGAVDIARLRFWLSLVVDEDEPNALPNLDYKIVVGNSLVSKLGNDIIDIDWSLDETSQELFGQDLVKQKSNLIEKISDKQKKFFNPDCDKHKLAADIRNLKIDLLINQLELMINKQNIHAEPLRRDYLNKPKAKFTKDYNNYLQGIGWKQQIEKLKKLKAKPDEPLQFFDWKLDFSEVMNEKVADKVGFDIVIGNPPYVNFKMYSSVYKVALKEQYPIVFNGKGDLYYYFYYQSSLLVKEYGQVCLITSRYWLEAQYALKLRNELVYNMTFKEIIDFKNATVFDGLGIKTCICHLIKRNGFEYNFKYRFHKERKVSGNVLDALTEISIPKFNISLNNWRLVDEITSGILNTIEHNTFQLDTIADCKQGIVTGLDRAFITLTEDFSNLPTQFVKTWIKVGDIHKYQIIPVEKRKLVYTNLIDDINDYADLHSRLKEYKEKLSNRREAENGKIRWFDLQWGRKPDLFENEKLICRFKAESNTFCYDSQAFYSSADTTIIALRKNTKYSLKYLLALLNSQLLTFYFKSYGKLMDYRFEYYPGHVGQLRIKECDNTEPFEIIVDKIIVLKSQGLSTAYLEQQIDNMVYKLYELTYEEVKVIDPDFPLSEQEYEAIKV